MRHLVVSAAALALCGGAALAQAPAQTGAPGGNDPVPCTQLPAAAAKSVPAPFDRYMRFACNRVTGQGLGAVEGFHWADPNGLGIGLSASKPSAPDAKGVRQFPLSWYTKLQPVTLSDADQTALRTDFQKILQPAYIDRAKILELQATTSNAEDKRIVLILPNDKPGLPEWMLGFECNGVCFRDDREPLMFAGQPNSAARQR
jgi:hypothetical protein